MYLEPEYARSRITDVGFKELVVLPREIDLNEWLASNSAWGAGSGRAPQWAAGPHPTEDSLEPVAGPALCLGSPTPGPVAGPGRARAGPPVPGSVWSGCVAAGLAVSSLWEGCGLWEGRVHLNSSHLAGLGLGAHGMAACRSPRGGDSGWPLALCPAWCYADTCPSRTTAASGRRPGPLLCTGTCVSGLWCALALRGSAGHWDAERCRSGGFSCPGLLFFCSHHVFPPRQPTVQHHLRVLHRRGVPDDGRVQHVSHSRHPGSVSSAGSWLRRPLLSLWGQRPDRGGTLWYRVCWGVGCQPARGRWLSSMGQGCFHSTCLSGFCKTTARQEATGASLLQLAVRLQDGFSRELLLGVKGVRRGTARDWVERPLVAFSVGWFFWSWDAFSVSFPWAQMRSFFSGSLCTLVSSVGRNPRGFEAPWWIGGSCCSGRGRESHCTAWACHWPLIAEGVDGGCRQKASCWAQPGAVGTEATAWEPFSHTFSYR